MAGMKIILQSVVVTTIINNNKTTASYSFKRETRIIRSTPADGTVSVTEVVVSLKHLSSFWRFLNLSLIKYETEISLSRSSNSVTSEMSRTPEIPANPAASPPTNHIQVTQTDSVRLQIASVNFISV